MSFAAGGRPLGCAGAAGVRAPKRDLSRMIRTYGNCGLKVSQ